ncbi:MAG: aldo/keto reductase [Firmicutes bacterium]|nr:aldo/keto reductase [Bacillota bacterium]
MKYINMNTGNTIPMLGFGVFKMLDKDECKNSVLYAIKNGYRLIDTAAVYTNEDAVGEAVKEAIEEGICTRDELFITSKLWANDMKNEDTAKAAIEKTMKKIGLDYLDLFLVHQALGDYFSGYRAMTEGYKAGIFKAIGVSNFYPNILTNFCETVEIIPAVNQIELHPYFVQNDALETMKYYNIVPEAWAPLGGGRYDAFNEPILTETAKKYNKTVGQVMLRWNVQRGVVVIPKSTHENRIKENFDIWDFELTEDEMNKISSLDMGYGDTRTKHFNPEFVRMCLNNVEKINKP